MDVVVKFIGYFLIYFAFYKMYYIYYGKKNKKFISSEVVYIIKKYNVSETTISYDKLLNVVIIANAILFAFSLLFVTSNIIANTTIKLLIIFVLLIPIIFLVYSLIGKIYGDKK